MGAYWNKLKRGLFAIKPYSYTATVDPSEHVKGVEISTNDSGQVLVIEFSQSVKDGNDISQMSLLSNGQTIYTDDLYPGETHYRIPFTSFELDTLEYSLVLIDSSKSVIEKTAVRIDEVSR